MRTIKGNGKSKLKKKLPTLAGWDESIKTDVAVAVVDDLQYIWRRVKDKKTYLLRQRKIQKPLKTLF